MKKTYRQPPEAELLLFFVRDLLLSSTEDGDGDEPETPPSWNGGVIVLPPVPLG